MSVPGGEPAGGPFDSGLQLERTSLSWRRTALSLALGSLVSLRLLPVWLGDVLWIVPGIAGLIVAALLWGVSRRRHDAFMAQVRRGTEPRQSGALPLASLAFGTALAGMLALVAVLMLAF